MDPVPGPGEGLCDRSWPVRSDADSPTTGYSEAFRTRRSRVDGGGPQDRLNMGEASPLARSPVLEGGKAPRWTPKD